MRKHLLTILATLTLLAGCQSKPTTRPSIGLVEVGGFVESWASPLGLSPKEKVNQLYLRDDLLFAYTSQNAVYAISASGGQVTWTRHTGEPGDRILPPLMLDNKQTILASVSTILQIDKDGSVAKTINIGHAVRSPLAGGAGNFIYCGLDYPNGGRMARIDLTKNVENAVWEFMSPGGFSAGPAFYEKFLYAGGEDGRVYAVNEHRDTIWDLPGNVFKIQGQILADLKADDFGVYVAATDTKLYCLDRATGKIKWQYFASNPLMDSPELTDDSVYQMVPGEGVVALDKTTGDFNRKPRWIALGTQAFLAADAQYVYLRASDNTIVGVDKQTGEVKFHSLRTDLVAFAANTKTSSIYASTADGQVYSIKPVTKPGTVGQVVKVDLEFERVAMAR
ncbi:MAG TPA: PQQ-binding-like beta-propeller repeat protein [Tepidisphaeraceae bacterium]|nr:PQQ-binding-like beta-propeller repeat protein [Tepidisphaeraceae bacterium]